MTTTMLEITSFNESTLTRTDFAPFAWFEWPMEIWQIVRNTFSNVRITHCRPSEVLVKTGGLKDIKKHQIIKGGALSPLFCVTRYESAEDFEKAKS